MEVIPNKWVEKERKKKKPTTESAYEYIPVDEKDPFNAKRPKKRFSVAARATYVRTLRGIRK